MARHRVFRTALPGIALLLATGATRGAPVEEIVVTGELREAPLLSTPSSVTVIDQETIRARDATHLEDVLATAPNVNLASGASRARFFQIRGIGERGQFAEPLNPSVGVIVDEVDLSGAATAATLFDVEQVEVFRGPQAGRYGANALAGLIVLRTAAPTATPEARVELDAGAFDMRRAAAVLSGPIAGETLTGRIAAQQHVSDGWMRNAFLNREDTNERDETSVRGRLRFEPNDRLRSDLSFSRIEVDNGYDAFTLDNSFTTLSDEPGRDEQDTTLASLHTRLATDAGFRVEAIVAASESRIDYSFDEDWTFTGFHPDGYTSTDRYLRDRSSRTLELRLASDETAGRTQWLFGVFDLAREVDLRRLYTFAPGPFTSRYDTRRSALYGELGHDLTDRLHLSGSLRVERRDDRYRDSDAVAFDPEETLVGGRLVAEWTTAGGRLLFASISRGYKAGGFNTDGTLDADLREYDAESVWNYEAGLKGSFLDDTLSARLAAFLMDRRDQQVSTSLVRVREDGSAEFIDFTGNAAEGRNYGLELEVDWAVGARLDLRGSLGLLATRLEDFVNSAGDDLSGRDQAHAPNWQFSLAGDYDLPGPFFARLETEGRDAFYWSDSHDARARGYVLAHARLGWRREGMEVAAWVRNLTDETFGVRGFGGFGNDPRNGYAVGEYVQFGQPRAWGVGTRIRF